ncbi:MAG: FkbM family methyltransferase [Verrucomicrobia bacterium]|nr:FkbM family methyltransferase [Verrucomicrobiota bacterium]
MGLLAAINRWPVWRRSVRVGGARFVASSFDRLVYLVLQKFGWMGADERGFFARHVRPGMRVVEAGANLGVFTLQLSKLVGPEGKVFAFEPDPSLHAALVKNLERNGATNVVPIPRALGSRTARLGLKTFGLNSGDNRLCDDAAAPGATPVDVVTMDDALAGERVDFLKLDVQGWELEALRGMTRILAENPSVQLFVEFWPYGLRRAGCAPLDLIAFLHDNRFRLASEAGQPFTAEDASRWDNGSRKFTNLYATRN